MEVASCVAWPLLAVNPFEPNPYGTAAPPSAFAVRCAVVHHAVLDAGALLGFRRRDI